MATCRINSRTRRIWNSSICVFSVPLLIPRFITRSFSLCNAFSFSVVPRIHITFREKKKTQIHRSTMLRSIPLRKMLWRLAWWMWVSSGVDFILRCEESNRIRLYSGSNMGAKCRTLSSTAERITMSLHSDKRQSDHLRQAGRNEEDYSLMWKIPMKGSVCTKR